MYIVLRVTVMKLDELEKDLRDIKSKLEENSYDPFQPNDYNRGLRDGIYDVVSELETVLEKYFK